MKRIGYTSLALMAICTVLAVGVAQAAPVVNGAKIYPRFFNDCGITNLTITNTYPGLIKVEEGQLLCTGGANLHDWDLSSDGGASSAVFNNNDSFTLSAVLQLDRTGGVGTEAGLRISPWWDKFANGYFNVRLPDGEIAAFGGVLPGFNFTTVFGIHYVQGTQIHLQINYDPHCNTETDPGTINYIVDYQGQHYESGPLGFGNCTPGEEIHGCYGIMDDARVGGRVQNNLFAGGGDGSTNTASFFDIFYASTPGTGCPVPTKNTTWGSIKGSYR